MDHNIEIHYYDKESENPIVLESDDTLLFELESSSCVRSCHIFLCFIILLIMIFGSMRVYQLL